MLTNQAKRIWLVTIGEPLPTDGSNERLLRTGILAEQLSKQGHEVLWWTSSFDHVRKRQRATQDQRIAVREGYDIALLAANSYPSNVSYRRIKNHRTVAKKFAQQARREPLPDVIMCSWPLVELCVEAVRFGKENGVPVVLDVRDMWPDAIVDLAPRALRSVAKFAMRSGYREARYAASHATSIIGITEKIVDWGVSYSGRSRSSVDRAFPMGYRNQVVSEEGVDEATEFWRSHDICASKSEFVLCFFGTIGRHFEIEPIVEAARCMDQTERKIKFVLCGDGPHLPRWRQLAVDCPSIVLPGWVDAAKIRSLMQLSSAGLAPYYSSWDFTISLPNKPIEYLSAGLPVISSLQGELANLLAQNDCGMTYQNGEATDLVRVITACYDSRDTCARMAKNATALFCERFVAEKVYGHLSNFLTQLADNRRDAA